MFDVLVSFCSADRPLQVMLQVRLSALYPGSKIIIVFMAVAYLCEIAATVAILGFLDADAQSTSIRFPLPSISFYLFTITNPWLPVGKHSFKRGSGGVIHLCHRTWPIILPVIPLLVACDRVRRYPLCTRVVVWHQEMDVEIPRWKDECAISGRRPRHG